MDKNTRMQLWVSQLGEIVAWISVGVLLMHGNAWSALFAWALAMTFRSIWMSVLKRELLAATEQACREVGKKIIAKQLTAMFKGDE